MNRAKTFGDFLIAKRMEREMSARQLAIKLDFSLGSLFCERRKHIIS